MEQPMSLQTKIETAQIPGTEIKPSRIALGTWAIGGWMWGGSDDALSIRTIQSAVDRGITLIDTAPVYGFGHAEEIVGVALRGRRAQVAIATKAGSTGRTASRSVTPAAAASCRRSTIRCAGCRPMSSIFIRCIGPIRTCRWKRPPAR
jgi:aryl-alcohol dehydrogenase-like predicted oxidoreductase